ncbi:OsmC family protein [Streptococcus sp. sy018]|uniref:OsmC family protein n=1 Tax=Streptococcus sp. sy018 TaxID=2600147 RepID=UPI0011B6DB11|nr:OsmC family protein [Streptococcus sp. sy018]TWS95331.1 OsmC family protein [Streptococcus sp. sy018]
MYQTKIIGQDLYRVRSEGYGTSVELLGQTKDGETPMSLLNIALAGCITMCVQGYFYRYHKEKQVPVTVDSRYEADLFQVRVNLPEALEASEQDKLSAYIDKHCRVKKLLREDLTIVIDFKV